MSGFTVPLRSDQVATQPIDDQYLSSDVIKALGSVYGERADQVARALRTPASWYSIRVNELKAKVGDITEFLSRMGLQVKTYPELPEAIAVRVEGP